jgi:hypothetical protein
MKRTVAIMAGLALGVGLSMANAQQEDSEEFSTDSSIVSEEERQDRTGTDDSTAAGEYDTQAETGTQTEIGTQAETEPQTEIDAAARTQTSASAGGEAGTGLSEKSAAELSGKAVVTAEGEEIGAIQDVGYSERHQARVATVEVGGFVGAGEKLIAIPLAELSMGSDDAVTTSMTRESIENREAYDKSDLSADE